MQDLICHIQKEKKIKMMSNITSFSDLETMAIIGREAPLFTSDFASCREQLVSAINLSKVLIIGGGGSIGRAVTIEIFDQKPSVLHVVDVSENNLVELVRFIRSTREIEKFDFKTFSIDCGGIEFGALLEKYGSYDYVFNLSALKHVRSERDPFSAMRMIQVNIINTVRMLRQLRKIDISKYFSVSTDKAANPANLMGASKRVMEMVLFDERVKLNISLARFANVAFSDGSLLDGFSKRFSLKQPIAAPRDIYRYFITPKESGQFCFMAGVLGFKRDIFFPKLSKEIHMASFSDIASRYIRAKGFEPFPCDSSEEAKFRCANLISSGKWPCYFFDSDTTGEKPIEEFYTSEEKVEWDNFREIGVIKNTSHNNSDKLDEFLLEIKKMQVKGSWDIQDIIFSFDKVLDGFCHIDRGKSLDQVM